MTRTIPFGGRYLSYGDSCALARRILARRSWQFVHIRLDHTLHTSTAALARLVLLRRELLKRGRELRIAGLQGKAKALYDINRLDNILPVAEA